MEKMNHYQIKDALDRKDYDSFPDELYLELQMFPQEYSSIDEMIDDQGSLNMARFLCEDFPDRFEW